MLLFADGGCSSSVRWVRYVPVSIIVGFTNGIAVLIGLSQVKDLLGLSIDKMPADFFSQIGALWLHKASFNPYALGLGLACFAGLFLWPRLFASKAFAQRLEDGPSIRSISRIPGPVVALVTMTLLSWYFALPVETIGTRFGGIPRSLPDLALPPFSWDSAKQLLIPTLTIALLGAIESLLCARVADNLTDDLPRHDPNQELMAQGVANMVSPMFGGMPATGTIARTVTNVRSGARSPIAGIVHAGTLLAVVLLAAPLAVHIPLPALAGILLFVAWNMGEWHEFARLRQFSVPYRTILVGTFLLTVIFDLTVAVEVGLVLACFFFIYRMGTLFRVQPSRDMPLPEGVVVFELFGSLFFGAVARIEALEQQVPAGTRAVVLEMHRLISMDTSGLDALDHLHRTLKKQGVALVLADVNEQPLSLMRRSGFAAALGEDSIVARLPEALARVPAGAATTPR